MKIHECASVLLVMCGLALTGCDTFTSQRTAGSAPYSIRGTITQGGAPMAGVTVSFIGIGAPAAVQTDANGVFTQRGFPARTYIVEPSDGGANDFYYNDQLVNPSVTFSGDRSGVDFEGVPYNSRVDLLSPNGGGTPFVVYAPVRITWRVRGSQIGSSVSIYVRDGDSNPWQSIGTGTFTAPADDNTWVEANVDWTPTVPMAEARVKIQSNSWSLLVDQSDANFRITQEASVSGQITFEGTPLANALIQFFSMPGNTLAATTQSEADGSYIRGLLPGNYRIVPAKTGLGFTAGPMGDTVTLTSGEAATDYDFMGSPAGANLIVTNPNGNEVFFAGVTYTVQATATSLNGETVIFDADLNGDSIYETAIGSTAVVGNLAAMNWTVPAGGVPPELANALIRIRHTAYGLSDTSDAAFIISVDYTLSGKVTTDGTTPVTNAKIRFSGSDAPAAVLTNDSGVWTQRYFRMDKIYTVEVVAPDSGTAHATGVPGVPLTEFGLRVYDSNSDGDFADSGEADYYDRTAGSRSDFPSFYATPALSASISGINFLAAAAGHTLSVVHPTGTDVWPNGYQYKTIEWSETTTYGSGASVDIYYSANAGGTWGATPIFAATPNDGSEVWEVGSGGATASYVAKVRVVDTTYRLVRGMSPQSFVLVPSGAIQVQTQTNLGIALPNMLVGLELAGFAAYRPPEVDPFRPFLTNNVLATDNGILPLGVYRLTPNRVGYVFNPTQSVVGVDAPLQVFTKQNSGDWVATSSEATITRTGLSLTNAPSARDTHTAVWTGTQMVVWGGMDSLSPLDTGSVWTPSTGGGSWGSLSTVNAPSGRYSHTVVWTGTQMVVWGGYNDSSYMNTGGIWTPSSGGGTWESLSTTNAPTARYCHTAVWTGTQMVIWGGYGDSGYENEGGIWTPGPNGGTWESLSTTNAPELRYAHTAVWTGTQMVVWGGMVSGFYENTGGIWTPGPGGGTWETLSTTNAPEGREYHRMIWTGTQMVVWGGSAWRGFGVTDFFNTGGIWTPGLGGGTWESMSTTNAPSARTDLAALWTGTQMVVWGGTDYVSYMDTGGMWTPGAGGGTWESLSAVNAPSGRSNHAAVWTGTQMVVWGGSDVVAFASRYFDTGGLWTPGAGGGSWYSTPGSVAITDSDARYSHTAIWTGTQMVIWGGYGSDYEETGLIWTPGVSGEGGVWDRTSTVSAPLGRYSHTAVWTGAQMVVWGGYGYVDAVSSDYLDTGGIWTSDSGGGTWESLSTINAPSGRYYHTAIWTGTQMVVWGGEDWSSYMNTGGICTPGPGGGTWGSLSTTNAPSARSYHTAVWTGTQMVVWGGYGDSGYENTGCLWTPGAGGGTWSSLSTVNAPSARYCHTAVWTGTQMVVWGGISASGHENTGGIWTPGPGGGTWESLSTANAPEGRSDYTTVWTGAQMVVWGGYNGSDYVNTGRVWTPGAGGGTWSTLPTTQAPSRRNCHTAVWTGSQMVVWGGYYNGDGVYTGGILTIPESGTQRLRSVNAPTNPHAIVPLSNACVLTLDLVESTITTRIYHGPNATIDVHNNPQAVESQTSDVYPDYWSLPDMATANQPAGLEGVAVGYLDTLTSDERGVCVWGGSSSSAAYEGSGAFFNETTQTWSAMQTTGAPSARKMAGAVSLGDRLFIWGGEGSSGLLDDGGIYHRATNTWSAVSSIGAPASRKGHGTAYGGGKVYVFGGMLADGTVTNTGGIYDSDSGLDWTPLDTANAPTARTGAFMGWTPIVSGDTGGGVIVWGGQTATGNPFHDGGVYSENLGGWITLAPHDATSNPNAPPPAIGRQACLNPSNGHLMVFGGLLAGSGDRTVCDTRVYEFDPDTWTWAIPVSVGDPTQPQLDFKLIHTGLGTRNNLIMMGGHVSGTFISGGFIR